MPARYEMTRGRCLMTGSSTASRVEIAAKGDRRVALTAGYPLDLAEFRDEDYHLNDYWTDLACAPAVRGRIRRAGERGDQRDEHRRR